MDVSSEGTLIYVPTQAEPDLRLTWVDRRGREEPLALEPASYWTPRLSPDGRRVGGGDPTIRRQRPLRRRPEPGDA